MADEIPTFWGVWAHGLKTPEWCDSRDLAISRAYEMATSHVGLRVHLVETKSSGWIEYAARPTLTGILAAYPLRDNTSESR
jgi:hypothetical protein